MKCNLKLNFSIGKGVFAHDFMFYVYFMIRVGSAELFSWPYWNGYNQCYVKGQVNMCDRQQHLALDVLKILAGNAAMYILAAHIECLFLCLVTSK